MHRALKRVAVVIGGALLVAATSGCGSNVKTPPAYTALHYSGGATSGAKFIDCLAPGQYRQDGWGDTHYQYPTGNQRTYDASDDPAAEQKPVTVVSSDNQEMSVPAAVTFHLTGDCATLQKFHEKLGLRYNAFWVDPEGNACENDKDTDCERPEGNAGWLTMLRFVFGKSLDTGLDREAQNYKWQQLWNDPGTKTAVEGAMQSKLQGLIDGISGAPSGPDGKPQSYFVVDAVRIQKPDPTNPQLRQNIAAAQAEVAKAETAKAQADAQKAAAEAQVAVARAEAAQVEEQIKVLGKDGYLAWLEQQNRQRAIDKGLNPYPSPIVAGVGAR